MPKTEDPIICYFFILSLIVWYQKRAIGILKGKKILTKIGRNHIGLIDQLIETTYKAREVICLDFIILFNSLFSFWSII